MKKYLIFLAVFSWLAFGEAAANDIHFCDSCSVSQRGSLANQLTSGLGSVYIGDRTTGTPYLYTVNTVNASPNIQPPGIQEHPVAQEDADQFAVYSEVFRTYGNIGVLNVKLDFVTGSASVGAAAKTLVTVQDSEASAFASAFDVRTEGSTRQQVIQWLEAGNWGNQNLDEKIHFFLQQVLSNIYKWRSSENYGIRIDATFNDRSRAVFSYDSSKNAIVYVEAYDSAGNLIGTSNGEPVKVDYSSYEGEDAKSRPDYERGLNWLIQNGAATISGGTVTVGTGTVLVGDIVTSEK